MDASFNLTRRNSCLEIEALNRTAKQKTRLAPASLSVNLMNRESVFGIEHCYRNLSQTFPDVATSMVKMEVKAECLSPAPPLLDNNSSGSRSNTPTSSYQETSPGVSNQTDRVPSPSSSPAVQRSQPKANTEHPVARNYSDIMRSLAAKYNNSNPNDYIRTTRSGIFFDDQRFPIKPAVSPFTELIAPLASGATSPPTISNSSGNSPSAAASNTKESFESCLNRSITENSLPSGLGVNSFSASTIAGFTHPLFSPLVDVGTPQGLLNIIRYASENYTKTSPTKRVVGVVNNPLDLSFSAPSTKKRKRCGHLENWTKHRVKDCSAVSAAPAKVRSPKSSQSLERRSSSNCLSICTTTTFAGQTCSSRECLLYWSVDDVHNFVSSIDLCSEYADIFREQSIDGISLPMLTEEHLRTTMNMKLGPALKFRAMLAQKIGHCAVCMHCLHCHLGNNGQSLTPVPSSSPEVSVVQLSSSEH